MSHQPEDVSQPLWSGMCGLRQGRGWQKPPESDAKCGGAVESAEPGRSREPGNLKPCQSNAPSMSCAHRAVPRLQGLDHTEPLALAKPEVPCKQSGPSGKKHPPEVMQARSKGTKGSAGSSQNSPGMSTDREQWAQGGLGALIPQGLGALAAGRSRDGAGGASRTHLVVGKVLPHGG